MRFQFCRVQEADVQLASSLHPEGLANGENVIKSVPIHPWQYLNFEWDSGTLVSLKNIFKGTKEVYKKF